MQKDLALFGLRTTLAAIFIVHACDKLGWHSLATLWEVDNLTLYSKMALMSFTELTHSLFPSLTYTQAYWLAAIAACGELIAGWCLLLGLFCRLAGLFLVCMMAVAIYHHFPFGFDAIDGGYQWAMLCLGGSQAIMLLGSGRLSIQGLLQAITTEQIRAV